MNRHLDDDAISASLDGEDTPEERAHLESCEECQARAAAFRSAARLIGNPPTIDPRVRDRAITAALQQERRRPPMWALAAAAAVLALGALVPLLARNSNNDNVKSASTAARSQELASTTAPARTNSGAASSAAPLDLASVARSLLNQPSDTAAPTCESAVRARATDLGALRAHGTVVVEGRQVEVLVFAHLAFAVAIDTCQDERPPVSVD